MWAFYGVSMGLVLAAVTYMTRRYVAPKISLLSVVVTCVAWLTSLSVIALVPIDVYSTLADIIVPALDILWSVSYWSTQVLTWAVIPILQNYVSSGGFTVLKRLGSALHKLWMFYLIVGSLAVVGVLVALAMNRLQLSTLPALVITLSNAYGLICIIMLLGYGLVEVPRSLWRRSFPESRLKWHFHRVGKSAEKLTEASVEMEKVLTITLATTQQIPRSDPHLRSLADAVVKYLEEYSPVGFAVVGRGRVDIESLEESDLDYASDEAGLARLRARGKAAVANFVGCRGEYLINVERAMHLQSVCKSRALGMYVPPTGSSGRWAIAAWYCACRVKPWILRAQALIAAAASATVVWSEATIATGRDPDLSPFSLLIHAWVVRAEFLNQLVIALPLAYMCAATYFSLFKLGNFGFYHLVPGATWSRSLLLNGSLLARFAPPLCYNFLHVIRMNEYMGDGQRMVFISKMGSAFQDIPVLGQSFNTWFPLALVVYVALLTFNLWEQCASKFLTPAARRFDVERADDEHSSKGQRLVAAEQEALLGGGALGDGVGLHGVGAVAPVTAAASSPARRGVRAGFASRESSSIRLNLAPDSADPEHARSGVELSAATTTGRRAQDERIDDLFHSIGGRKPRNGPWE